MKYSRVSYRTRVLPESGGRGRGSRVFWSIHFVLSLSVTLAVWHAEPVFLNVAKPGGRAVYRHHVVTSPKPLPGNQTLVCMSLLGAWKENLCNQEMFFSAEMWNPRSEGKYSKIKVYVYNNEQLYWPVAHMQMVWGGLNVTLYKLYILKNNVCVIWNQIQSTLRKINKYYWLDDGGVGEFFFFVVVAFSALNRRAKQLYTHIHIYSWKPTYVSLLDWEERFSYIRDCKKYHKIKSKSS